MNQFLKVITTFVLAAAPRTDAFPAYGSLGGLSKEQPETIVPRLEVAPPEDPPGPLSDTSTKLVNDADHPWMAPGPNDIRGPCPGLNTLASHGVGILLYFRIVLIDITDFSTFLVAVLPPQLR